MSPRQRPAQHARPKSWLWGEISLTIEANLRLGEINPEQEPYRSELERQNIEVFDLTKLKGGAHDRAFEDITQVW